MKVLVLGGGFVSQALMRKLHALGYDVTLYQRRPSLGVKARIVLGDVTDARKVAQVLMETNPEVVFYLAGATNKTESIDILQEDLNNSLLGIVSTLSSCCRLKALRSVVVTGSVEEYGISMPPFTEEMRERPTTTYSLSKACQSHICDWFYRVHGLPVVVLRPSIIYGPAQRETMFLPALITTLLRDEQFKMTQGEQKRDFIFVEDVVDAMLKAAVSDIARGEIINIGLGKSVKIQSIALRVASDLNRTHLLTLGALPYRQNESFAYALDVNKARQLLNWKATTKLDEGLLKTIDYYKQLNT